jgi:hypothetical protein
MANDTDDTRKHGIEFGALTGDLDDESYPLSHKTLLSRYGDRELDLIGERVTLREVLSSDPEREYEDAESVRQTVFNMVGDEAVGRENYSDRGGSASEAHDSTETESL